MLQWILVLNSINKHEGMFAFHIFLFPRWNTAGSWNPLKRKSRIAVVHIINIMVARSQDFSSNIVGLVARNSSDIFPLSNAVWYIRTCISYDNQCQLHKYHTAVHLFRLKSIAWVPVRPHSPEFPNDVIWDHLEGLQWTFLATNPVTKLV